MRPERESPSLPLRHADRIGRIMATTRSALDFLGRSTWPFVDLAIRLWLAQTFFVSGVLKVGNWDNALLLAREEYPVAWMDPVTAAFVGAAIELVAPLFIAAGLATRVAALPLLALSLVIQFNYRALDTHLFWAAVCGWYVVRGAGALSLDRLLARGLWGSALPLTATIGRVTTALDRFAAPVYTLAVRLWLAAAAVLTTLPADAPLAAWFPLRSFAPLGATALPLAVLLAVGFAARPAAAGLMLLALIATPGAFLTSDYFYWLLLVLAPFVLDGAGALSLDQLLFDRLRRRYPQLDGKPAFALDGLPRVVIVGAGFGGIACAARLAQARVSVTLVDRNNYHLFQPLLYQVATAALSPGDIAMPIRALFREHFNIRVLLGEVTGVDSARREVLLGERRLPYDYLVLATGATHSYFGRDEWAPFAPGLKRVEDATEVRRRLLLAFERAEAEEDAQVRAGLLTFLVVGGGPTGVELAGAIAELARLGMEKEFRRFDPAQARVILVQSAPRLLPTFPERLSARTRAALERLGVEVLTDSRVEQIDEFGVTVGGRHIAARTVFWAAGVTASPAAKWIGATADASGRIKVGPDLSVPGLPEVFAIGDTALAHAWNGQPVPGLAPAAKQAGDYVARVIRARIEHLAAPPPFRYTHLGSLATIGRKAAVVDFGRVRLAGTLAWWLWGLVHVFFLIGARNRVSVMLDWFWAYLTYSASTRLITGAPTTPAATHPEERREIQHA
jgi:NADH dehydrogenase/putative oxidoreductase